jgi:EpsI family protein
VSTAFERPSRRQLLLGGALVVAAGTAFAREPRTRSMAIGKDELEGAIPKKIAGWTFETKSGLVLPPPDQLSQQLYDQMLTRAYSSEDSLPVMLLIAYGSSQSGMLQVHRPEVCYPAGGYQLSPLTETAVATGLGGAVPSRFFTASGETRTEQLLYWTRIGRSFPGSWAEQRWAVVKNNLAGIIPDGVLVRLSTVTPDPALAAATLKRFAAAMITSAPPKGRNLLLGVPGAY